MRLPKYLQTGLIGVTALLGASGQFVDTPNTSGSVVETAVSMATGTVDTSAAPARATGRTATALEAFAPITGGLSHPRALEDAFKSYYAYRAANPRQVRNPYLYFVDYGLPNTTPRGWVFDMNALTVVEGPFTVAHGRGSSSPRAGIPTRFSNVPGSAATSLGLYLAQETYSFLGKAAGRFYNSVGLRLEGVSGDFNDNARMRRVVAHGAPYVTAKRAGRSEGCPAMEQSRARRLLPKLANGGMVFLFAPNPQWLAGDPWITAASAD